MLGGQGRLTQGETAHAPQQLQGFTSSHRETWEFSRGREPTGVGPWQGAHSPEVALLTQVSWLGVQNVMRGLTSAADSDSDGSLGG